MLTGNWVPYMLTMSVVAVRVDILLLEEVYLDIALRLEAITSLHITQVLPSQLYDARCLMYTSNLSKCPRKTAKHMIPPFPPPECKTWLKSQQRNSCPCTLHHHVSGPNLPPSGTLRYEHACQSHPFLYTSVPHHVNPLVTPGYINPKKTTTIPNANPESSAADSVIVYFAHHAGARRLIT